MSVFLILIGPPRNSQCKLQSLQAALVCVQSPNFNSLRSLLWLTYKEHDEGHWRKRARTEEGAENLNRKHWASPKPSQLSNCWFLAWKSLLSSPSACLLYYVLLMTNKWNQNCLSEMHMCCPREALHCVTLGKKAEIWGIHQEWELTAEMFAGPSVPQCFCSLEVIVASYFTGWISAASRKSSCFWPQELFTERAPFFFSSLHWVLKKHQSMLALVGRKHPVKRLSGALD